MIVAKGTLRIVCNAAALALALAAGMLAPTASIAARPNAYVITNVNQRAGPGTEYPVIVTVPASAPITILGCLGDYAWCDVVYRASRGWMRAIYLKGLYRDGYYALSDYAPQMRYSIVKFEINEYWNFHYRNRPFYADRARWARPRAEGWVNRATFYAPLERHGDWVWLRGQYVWVPAGVDSHWRPYTVGRWVYTDRYGWMWVSSEPFGWATYHYGRWGFSDRVGWFWVPGNRWAPAWVSWRSSDDYLAWAPLPPGDDDSVTLSISVGNVPDYYWQVVPSQSFLAVNVSLNVVRDERRFTPILEQTRPLGDVTINNNVVVNNVVNITYVEEKTKEKVVTSEVALTKDVSKAGKVEGSTVEIFQPAVDQPPASQAPPEVKKIEQVAKESQTKEQAGGQGTTEQLLLPPEVKPAAGAPPPAESIEQASPEPAPPPAAGEPALPATEKAPAEQPPSPASPQSTEPAPAPKGAEQAPAASETAPPPDLTPPPAQGKPPKATGESGAPPPPAAAVPPATGDEGAPPQKGRKAKTKELVPEEAQPQQQPVPPLIEKDEAPAKRQQGAPEDISPQEPPTLPIEEGAPPEKQRKPRAEKVLPEEVQPEQQPAPASPEKETPPKDQQASPEDIGPREPPTVPTEEGAPPPMEPERRPGDVLPEETQPEQHPTPAQEQPASCPEGTVQGEDGSCLAPPEQ